jgi:hypothetical protein
MKSSRLCISLFLLFSFISHTNESGLPPDGMRYFAKDAAEIIQQTIENASKDFNESADILKVGMENTAINAARELTQNPIKIQFSVEKETMKFLSKLTVSIPLIVGGFLLIAHATKNLIENHQAISKETVKIAIGFAAVGSGYWIMH